ARSELRYDVNVAAAAVARSQGVVLRRTDAAQLAAEARTRRRVVQRLAGPGMAVASGVFHLGDADRRALSEGRLWLVHVTSDAPLGLDGPLQRSSSRPR
ncbi:MAG: hypothetical protein ACRENH_15290, partial [Gemmatimonadaceae bacterium]